jgi:hypothetical protein
VLIENGLSMTAFFSSNHCNSHTYNSGNESLPMAEDALTLALLLYSLQHLKNITTTLKQRQEVIDACSTNATLAQLFPSIDKKIFIPCIISELLCMASSCCFALAKFYGSNTELYGYKITPFHLSALEVMEARTMNTFYKPNIDTLMNSIFI